MSKPRTEQQNKSIHLWFTAVAKECLETGVTVNDILGKTASLQVDEDFIKWMFRRIGKKKYGKESTTQLESYQIDLIYDEMVKFFAEKVDPPMQLPPLPSKEITDYEQYVKNTKAIETF